LWKEDHAAGAQMVITAHSKDKKKGQRLQKETTYGPWMMVP